LTQQLRRDTDLKIGIPNGGENIDAQSVRIENVAAPTESTDAVNKAYADAISAAAGNVPTPNNPADDGKLLTAGSGTFTWASLTIPSDAITTAKIADSNVTTAKIADSNVTTAKIADSNVTTAKIADSNVTYAKIQNVSATDKLLGRSTAGAGVVEEITCTAAGRALLDDVNAAAQRTTLGLGVAPILQTVTNFSAAVDSTAVSIPLDDTIPQSNEGKEFINASITPLSNSNKVIVTIRLNVGVNTATAYVTAAVFRDSVANALDASAIRLATTAEAESMFLTFIDTPATTSEVTYKVRFGANTGTAYVNQQSGGRYFGGVANSGIILQEVRG
jgi:hypothetical protein